MSPIVFLSTKNRKESCEKLKNVIFSPLKHHYPPSTAQYSQPCWSICIWEWTACLTFKRQDKCLWWGLSL